MRHLGLLTISLVLLMTALFNSTPANAQIIIPRTPVYVPSPSCGPTYVDPNKNPSRITLPKEPKVVEGSGTTSRPTGCDQTNYESDKKINCSSCSGTGKCHVCHGKGMNYHGSRWNTCGACNGTGNCYTCKGKGWHY